jgi:hypothetical protein
MMRARSPLAMLAAATLLVVAWLSPRAVPYNMDEFVHYQALACATLPQARDLPSFRDGCSLYDLRLPFTPAPLPLRSYLYVGSVPAVPFYPFWRAIGDPVAVRVQGAVFALVSLVLAGRLLGVRLGAVALAGLVFPLLLVTFVVDEGPVGISAVAFLGALVTLRRALRAEAPAARAAWGALAGLLLFAGLWAKLVFAWWLPAVVCFAASVAWPRRESISAAARRAAPALAAAALACLVPTAVLLASVDRDGRPYLDTALHRGRIELRADRLGNEAGRLWTYAVDGARVAPRNLALPSWPVDAVPLLVAGALVAAALRRRRLDVAGWAALALATFAFASASAYSQWPHHFFFPLLLLALGLAAALDALSRRGRAVVAVAVVLFWATLAARWPWATFPTDSSFAKDEMLRYVREERLDRDRLQVHASWGTYYIAQLFGDPARASVFLKALPDDARQLAEVRSLAAGRGRRVLLYSSRRWERIQTGIVDETLGPPVRTWRFGDWWAAEYDVVGRGVKSASPRP